MKYLEFPERKQIRAGVIARYMNMAGYTQAVCFSCGNASQSMIDTGIFTIPVGPNGVLNTNNWWTINEIHYCFPGFFDITSGHLQLPLMKLVSDSFKHRLGNLKDNTYEVPTGSGETILCLHWAYPQIKFIAVYNVGKGTEYDSRNPLNAIIEAEFEVRR